MNKSMKCLISLILLCVLLAGCSAGESGSSGKQHEGTAAEHTAGSVESAPTVEELEESKIETAYGTLYYAGLHAEISQLLGQHRSCPEAQRSCLYGAPAICD